MIYLYLFLQAASLLSLPSHLLYSSVFSRSLHFVNNVAPKRSLQVWRC